MNAFSMTTGLDEEATEPRPARKILFGRFMLPDMTEHACQLSNIDADGADLLCDYIVDAGTSIIAYLDDIGRVDGTIERNIDGGFHIAFKLTGARRERMEKRLDWLKRPDAGERRHDRFQPKKAISSITLTDGREYDCEVLDISVSGAAVKIHVLPSIGTYVSLGKMRGRIVRYTSDGIGIEFMRKIDPQTFAAHTSP